MSKKKHIVIFSHGFGVRKDDRGLLSGIAALLPEVEPVLFDYFEVDEAEQTLTIRPFSEQQAKLSRTLEKAKRDNPGAIIDVVCHSQGAIPAALAVSSGVRKTILTAPPFEMDLERSLARYRSKPDTVIDLDGISRLYPQDGLTRLVPPAYWRERRELLPLDVYNTLSERTEVIAIVANQDQLLPKADLRELSPEIKVIFLDGDHSFSGPAREPLINILRNHLVG